MAGDGVLVRHVNALGFGCEHASFCVMANGVV
jgi:hypothetical protein